MQKKAQLSEEKVRYKIETNANFTKIYQHNIYGRHEHRCQASGTEMFLRWFQVKKCL